MLTKKIEDLISPALMAELFRDYDAGQIFFERPLCRRLNWEPIIMRDALLRLEAYRIIMKHEGKHKGGWRIVSHSLAQQREMLETRRLLLHLAIALLQEKLVGIPDLESRQKLLQPLRKRANALGKMETSLRDTPVAIGRPSKGDNTVTFIQEHTALLVDIARLAGASHVLDQITIINSRLVFCRIIYPDLLSLIVYGQANATRPFWNAGCEQLIDAIEKGHQPSETLDRHLLYFEAWNRHARSLLPRLADDFDAAREFVDLSWPMVRRVFAESRADRETLPQNLDVVNDIEYRNEVAMYFSNSVRASILDPGKPQVDLDETCNLPLLVLRTALTCGHLRVPEKDRKALHTVHIFNALLRQASHTRLSDAEYHALVIWRLLRNRPMLAGTIAERIGKTLKIDHQNVRFTLHRARTQLLSDMPKPLLYLLTLDDGMRDFLREKWPV
jgi:DNA-binding GntR family transcriptional regulator